MNVDFIEKRTKKIRTINRLKDRCILKIKKKMNVSGYSADENVIKTMRRSNLIKVAE